MEHALLFPGYYRDLPLPHCPRHPFAAVKFRKGCAGFKNQRVPSTLSLHPKIKIPSERRNPMSASIELKAPRLIVIEDRGKQYRLTIGRILKKQWLRYFEGILSTSENQGGKRIDSFDSSTARLELVEQILVSAEGYALPDGKISITEIEGWKALLPLSHRLAVANSIIGVSASEIDEEAQIALGAESVFLDAVWGAGEDGVMRRLHGLRHDFKTPTAEQQRLLSRASSRSRVIGGSRNGKTQWMGAQATLADLYDELIVSTGGYTVDGNAALDHEAIVEFMDTYHKVSAVDLLFAPAAPKVEEEE